METAILLLVFDLYERRYALPLRQVERVFRAVDVTPLPEAPAIVMGVVDVHGEILPVFNMRSALGFAEREIALDDQLLVARAAHRTVALAVDKTHGVVECPADAVVMAESILPRSQQFDGIVQLPDGLALIHDLNRFLSLEEDRILEMAMAGQEGNGHEGS